MKSKNQAVTLILWVLALTINSLIFTSPARAADNEVATEVTPIIIAEQPISEDPNSPWDDAATQALEDKIAGRVLRTTAFRPDEYMVASSISWFYLVYSESGEPMWNGVLNPNAPYNNQRGHTLWFLVDIKASSGDVISLDQYRTEFVSSDGLLNSTLVFTGGKYSTLAPGIKSDGTRITDGPTSQKVNRALFLARSKLFNTGSTQAGLNQVKAWVEAKVVEYGDYAVSCTVKSTSNEALKTTASVSIKGQGGELKLVFDRTGGISVLNAGTRAYELYSSTQIPAKQWNYVGFIVGTNKFPISPGGPARFYRARVY